MRFEYLHYTVVDSIVGGSESRDAARASECANQQGKFWEYHDYLFANVLGEGVGSFRAARLKSMAASLGLDTAAFNTCYDSGATAAAVDRDMSQAAGLGVTGTPSIFVNGQQVSATYEAVKAAIDSVLGTP